MKKAEYLDYYRIGSFDYWGTVHYDNQKPFDEIPGNRDLEEVTEEHITKGRLKFSNLLFGSVFCPAISFEKYFWDAAMYVCQDRQVLRFIGCVAPDTDSMSETVTIPGYRLLGQRQLTAKDLNLAKFASDIRPVWKVFELLDEYNDGYSPWRISVLLLNADSTKAFQAAFHDLPHWGPVPIAFLLLMPDDESECPDYLNKDSSFFTTVKKTYDSVVGMETYPGPSANRCSYPSLYFVSRADSVHTKDTVPVLFERPEFQIKRAAHSEESNVFVFTHHKKIVPRNTHIYSGKKSSTICEEAFKNDKDLKEFYAPERVMEIGREAFAGCERLDTVTLPDGVEIIGKEAFAGCKKLRSIVIPPNVKELKMGTFYNCEELTSVVLPEGLENIRLSCFFKCFALEEVKIPSTVKRIGEDAFGMCTQLRRVEIPSSTIVDPNAFRYANPECDFVYYETNEAETVGLS